MSELSLNDADAKAPPADLQIAPVPRISIQAFCETPETTSVIQAAAGDRRMDKAHVKVLTGGGPAAVEAFRTAPTPNLIIIETSSSRDALIEQLEALSEFCDAGTKVIVIGRMNDIVLYRDLMNRGISDYLVAPLSTPDLIRAVSNLYTAAGAPPVGRIIAVTGAKGGVGASTIAHNLAWTISVSQEVATVLIDMDIGFGTAGLDFNQDPPQGIAEAVFANDRLDANFVDRILSKCGENLSLMAAPATLERTYDLGETAFDGLLDILRSQVPVIVLDVPQAWQAWTRRMLVTADEVLLVAAPDLANLRNTKNLLDQLRAARRNDSPPRLLLNNVGVLKRPEIAPADFAKSVETEPVAVINFDAKLFGTAANNGQMIAEVDSADKSAEKILDLARVVTGRTQARKAKRNLLAPLIERFARKKA